MRFIDHREAGERLADELAQLGLVRPLVLAIPPAGARIGWEIARRLHSPMDVLVVNEVAIPGRTGSFLGAVVDGRFYRDDGGCRREGVSRDYAEILAYAVKGAELQWEDILRRRECSLDLQGRSVVLVSESTLDPRRLRAVEASLRERGAQRVIYASPFECTGPVELADLAIDFVSLFRPDESHSVMLVNTGYQQATDDEISRLIALSRDRGQFSLQGEPGVDDDTVPAATVEATAV